MRRVLAITLLLAFASPLVVPSALPLPILKPGCRLLPQHGKHHCAMMHMMLAANRGPALTTPPCPLYPAAIHLRPRHCDAD